MLLFKVIYHIGFIKDAKMTIKAGVFAGLRVQLAHTRSCAAVSESLGGRDQTSNVPDLPDLNGRRNDFEIPQTETSGTSGLQNLLHLPVFGCTVTARDL